MRSSKRWEDKASPPPLDPQQYNGHSRIPFYTSPPPLLQSVYKRKQVPPNHRGKPQSGVENKLMKELKRLRQGNEHLDDDE
ncbi:unnamed protein product [Cyprideis torosa]|uniref:Uncharacterized protein n=1 Tax=Cyprideis torosa TaxID=163714 RepID=A0A7R8WXX0_9CRUS|nr:unnamed protein product [Cyprideis torosa]CAG0908972.1 unnamed protein product [Cyprideis torosa]